MEKPNVKISVMQNAIGEVGSRLPLVVAEFLIAKTLQPSLYGIWAIVRLIANYSYFTHGGLINAFGREETYLLGKHQKKRAFLVRNTVFTADLLIITTLCIAFYFFINFGFIPYFKSNSIFTFSVILLLIAQQLYIYWQASFQNRFLFLHLSIVKLIYGFSFLIFVFLFMKGIVSLVFLWALSTICALVYFVMSKRALVPRFSISFIELKKLFIIGFPMLIFSLVKLGMTSFDRVAVALFLSHAQLGFYNIAAVLVSIVVLLGGLVSRAFSPHLIFTTAQEVEPLNLQLYFVNIVCKVMKLLSLVAAYFSVFLPWIIWIFLPKYIPGIRVGCILLFVGCLMSQIQFLSLYFLAVKKLKTLVAVSVFSLTFFVLLLILEHFIFNNILAFAVASFITWLLYSTILCFFMFKKTFLRNFLRLILPVIIFSVISFAILHFQIVLFYTSAPVIVKIAPFVLYLFCLSLYFFLSDLKQEAFQFVKIVLNKLKRA